MLTKLGVFAVFSLFVLIMVPVYAEVTTVSMKKSFYTINENISFFGTENEGGNIITVVVRGPNGDAKLLGGFSDPQGEYETIPKSVKNIFPLKGIYNVTAFVDRIEEGISMQLEFDGERVAIIPDFVLALNSIQDKTIEEKKTLVFTPTLTESITGVIFSLEKNPPSGASINNETGKFVWTPTEFQGPASYVFDIVVKKGASEDRENIKITVTEAAPIIQTESMPEPEPTQTIESEPTPEPEVKELGIAPFVDPTKDPQSYVDRYNNEPKYKEWFDKTYPEYSSIYQAVGLEKPKEIAPFVDPTLDPQFYIDRYNNEPKFKDWFDQNYPDMTIYDAVGLEKSEIKEQESGQCGTGTILVERVCIVDENLQEGGGCLIATAAYGSEMAPQVQFLREIRDNKVMSTASGISFMAGFNQLYYSFSPTIADLERENPAFKEIVKIGITPMLSSLSIMSAADSEQEIVGYGIGVILMNVGMYFVAPVMLFYSIKKAKTH
ncbi:MAG: putative Ig domain-containing protein [Nitrosarchaeum sp.]|nr:putative Ig domain-containing protein [Nitrosarchaeum sp.]